VTSYAGELTISWNEVASLSSENLVKVILSDQSVLEGIAIAEDIGKMRLTTKNLDVPPTISLSTIQTINPVPKPAVAIKALANAGISVERGNTESDNANFTGEFEARTELSRSTVYGEYNWEKCPTA